MALPAKVSSSHMIGVQGGLLLGPIFDITSVRRSADKMAVEALLKNGLLRSSVHSLIIKLSLSAVLTTC